MTSRPRPDRKTYMKMLRRRSRRSGPQQPKRRKGEQADARLSVQAVLLLCDGHRLVEDGVLEHVPLEKDRRT